ncbi:MAG TPA: protein kinase [Caldilineae bacterium]|nr:protein kinase [Caldilineae bacterium]HIQ12624.1 serine/threonine-protein kinase [Caldilineales bacterium]
MFSPGDAFGLYRIEREIGRGGMAIVYLAYHQWLDRPVALKVLRPELQQDEDLVARFLVEARSAARLEHPNIVAVHDAGMVDGVHYLAMEYVEGETLADVLARVNGPLPEDFIISVATQVASALDYAHRRGVVHRDVKPSNILVQSNGKVRLTDFGIAHAVGLRTPEQKAAVLGTPEYMSPEQAMGRPVDGRSDVYSLGVAVYHMLTGRPPFTGETHRDILYAHVHTPPPDPRSLNPHLPPEATRVMNRAMAKNPDDRYPIAGAFAQALRRALRPLRSEPVVVAKKTPMWLYALIGVLLGLAALSLTGWLLVRSNALSLPPTARPPASPSSTQPSALESPTPAQPPVAALPTATPTLTPTATETSTPTPTVTPTPTSTPTPNSPPRIAYVSDRTGVPQIYLIHSDGTHDVQLTFEGRNEHPFWSSDGAFIYFISDRGQGPALWSMRADGSEQQEVLRVPGSTGYALSPNGEHVTFLQPGPEGVQLFLDGLLWAAFPGQRLAYQWSPDSQHVVVEIDYAKTIGVLNIASSEVKRITDPAYASWNPAWSPDGQFVVFASTRDGNAGLYASSIISGDPIRLTPLDLWSQAPSWSPDGSLISHITGEDGGQWGLYAVDAAGANRYRLFSPVFPEAPAVWSSDSQQLAFIIQDGDDELAVVRRDGSGFLRLTNNHARDWDPAWEPR